MRSAVIEFQKQHESRSSRMEIYMGNTLCSATLPIRSEIFQLTAGPMSTFHLRRFLLEDGPKLRMYYAPFDWINTAAKIVVVGITPRREFDARCPGRGT